ncbi:MAG: hypothetical protein WC831_01785 [Parcubacteria group bacterium]
MKCEKCVSRCAWCKKPICDRCNFTSQSYLSERYRKWREVKKIGIIILREYEEETRFIGFCSLLLGDFARRNNLIVECRVRDSPFRNQRVLYLHLEEGGTCHTLEISKKKKIISFSWHFPIEILRNVDAR